MAARTFSSSFEVTGVFITNACFELLDLVLSRHDSLRGCLSLGGDSFGVLRGLSTLGESGRLIALVSPFDIFDSRLGSSDDGSTFGGGLTSPPVLLDSRFDKDMGSARLTDSTLTCEGSTGLDSRRAEWSEVPFMMCEMLEWFCWLRGEGDLVSEEVWCREGWAWRFGKVGE